MNLRIGDPEPDAQASSVRPGGAVGRTPSAVSDTGDGGGDLASPSSLGVVVRLSPDARKILARHDDERAGARRRTAARPTPTARPRRRTPARRWARRRRRMRRPRPEAAARRATTRPPATRPRPGRPPARRARPTRAGRAAPDADAGAEGRREQARPRATPRCARTRRRTRRRPAGWAARPRSRYETGPDGKRYAVGGEVPVSLRPGRTPQETIANAQTVRSAALAPADPSPQDLAVAAQASQMEAQARQEIAQNTGLGQDAMHAAAAPRPAQHGQRPERGRGRPGAAAERGRERQPRE